MESNITHSVWIGSELSIMERLTLTLLKNSGYTPTLWVQDYNIQGVPTGVDVKLITSDILTPIGYNGIPHSSIKGGGVGSLAHWSDYFAFYVMHKFGGMWVQLDVAVLKKIQHNADYWFTSWSTGVSPVLMKTPQGCEYSKVMTDVLRDWLIHDMSTASWDDAMILIAKIARDMNILQNAYLLDDGYYDCGGSSVSPYSHNWSVDYQVIHWSNATNNSSKHQPIPGSVYHRLCVDCGLIK